MRLQDFMVMQASCNNARSHPRPKDREESYVCAFCSYGKNYYWFGFAEGTKLWRDVFCSFFDVCMCWGPVMYVYVYLCQGTGDMLQGVWCQYSLGCKVRNAKPKPGQISSFMIFYFRRATVNPKTIRPDVVWTAKLIKSKGTNIHSLFVSYVNVLSQTV